MAVFPDEGDEGYSESPFTTQNVVPASSHQLAARDVQSWLGTMAVADREGMSLSPRCFPAHPAHRSQRSS
jgi:hypothetical protein